MSSGSRPRVAFLNRSFWPDVEATGQLLEELTEHLAERWDVTVVTGQPNRNPGNHEFVKRGVQVRDGVTIDRLGHTQFSKSSKVGRLTNLLSFTNQVRRWGNRNAANRSPDVIVSETDPFFLPIVSAKIARRQGCRFVAYLQDIYPDIAVALDVVGEGIISRQIRARLLAAYRQADRIVVLDEDMRDRLIGWGLPADKFSIVPNWMDTQKVCPVKSDNAFRRNHGLDNRFVVMHSGNMGMSQRLERLIDATCDPNWPQKAVVALVGDGARKQFLVDYAAHKNAEHVRFFDYQPRDELSQSLSAADLHVVTMDERIKGCLAPSKLYGILACGTPVMAIVPKDFGIAREIESSEVGQSVRPGDPQGMLEYVRWCIENPGEMSQMQKRARTRAETTYDRRVCCQQFARVLDDVMLESR